MKSIKILGLFVFLLMAFASSGQKFRYIKTGNYEGVVDLKPYYLKLPNTRMAKYIPNNRAIAIIEKKLSGMITSLADQYRVLNYFANPECNIKQMLRSYKRYYVGFYRDDQYFVNIDFCRKLPIGWPTPKQEPLFGGKCPYFFLRYDFQNDKLEMICSDDQIIEIDRSPEQIKKEPNMEELLK